MKRKSKRTKKKEITNTKSNSNIYLIIGIGGIIAVIISLALMGFFTGDVEEVGESISNIAIIKTNYGSITIELFTDDMPITTNNFVNLSKKGFYDGVIFHRIISGFMIQGGCPDGTGMGGPGYTIDCEFAGYNNNSRGTISMANAGPNTGGSQFFINLVDNHFLNNRHAVFGRVIEGMDVVDAIGAVETDAGDRPASDVIIETIKFTTK